MMPEDPAYITIRRNSHRTVHGNASGHHGGGGRQVLDDGISVLSYSSLEDNYDDDVGNNNNNNDSHSSSNNTHSKNSSALVAHAHAHSHAPSTIDEEESSSDDDAAAAADDQRHNPPPPSSSSSSSSPAAFPPDFHLDKSNSLIPPYFLCPITKCVMIDPVIDREGNTYERKAILRWLDLEDVSPLSRNPLSYHDLVPNRAVRDGIEKARREAWFQYHKKRDEEEEEREERERREKEQQHQRRERKKTTKGGEKRSGGKSDGKGTDRDRERERDGKDGSRDRDAAKDKERDRDGKDGRKKSSSSSRSNKDGSGSGSGSRDRDRDPLLSSSFKEDKSSRLLLQMQKELEALKRQQLEFQQQQQQQQQWNQCPTTASSGGKSSSRRKPDAEGIGPLDKSDRSSGERSSGTSGHNPTHSQSHSQSQSHRSSKSSKEKSSDPAVMRLPPPPPPRKESSRRLNGGLGSSMTGSFNNSASAAASAAAAAAASVASSGATATASASNKSHSTTAFRQAGDSSIVSNTASLTSTTMRRHNGWVVPIGVHKVTCAGPGLVVTVDVHRRSTPVKRIVPNIHGRNGSGPSKSGAAARKSNSFSSGTANVRGKTHRNSDHNHSNSSNNNVTSQDLILPNGSFVDVLMTEIHGGRVRGFIRWEEEVPVASFDGAAGSGHCPPGGERGDAIQELTKTTTAKRKSSFFLGKLKSHGHGLGLGSKDHDKDHVKDGTHCGRGGNATTEADAQKEGGNGIHGSGKAKHHSGGVATRQYEGWISLCWAGDPESAMEKANELAASNHNDIGAADNAKGEGQLGGRSSNGSSKSSSSSSSSFPKKKHSRGSASIAPSPREPSPSSSSSRHLSGGVVAASARDADEDVGPWTTPVPLGVYRINFGSGLPLRETPERDSSLLGMLERGQFAEVVETTVKNDRVRARCILTDGGTATNGNANGNGKSVSSGWISLLNVKTGSSGATCVPLGAYVTVSEHGCVVTEGAAESSKLKRTLTRGTCVEVCATRLEENNVVRGLLTSGGYATLISGTGRNDGGSNGRGNASGNNNKRDLSSESYLMPVPLGTYHILYEAGLPVTSGIDSRSDVVMKLAMNTRVEVVETSVENGRVRGRICHPSHGWISLFEPSCRWAKFVFSQ